MGRFALRDDDDEDHAHWEFQASEPGEEAALVLREEEQYNNDTIQDNIPSENSSMHNNPNDVASYDANQVGTPHHPYNAYSSSQPLFNWRRPVWIIFLACLIHKYLPPAPPDDTVTWNEFVTQHSTRIVESLTALAIDMPIHLGQWCWTGLSTDLQLAYENYYNSKTQSQTSCTIRRDDLFSIREDALGVIGQDTAVRLTLNAIQAHYKKSLLPRQEKDSLPLLLFFWTGFSSVGKRTLVHALARHVVLDCAQRGDTPPVLEISAKDYAAASNEEIKSLRIDLMHRIVRHVGRYPNGNMIIIKGVEDMAPDVFVWIARTLSAWKSTSNSFASDAAASIPLPPLNDDDELYDDWQQYNCCPNTVIVMTSTVVGRNVITRTLRQKQVLSPYDATFLGDLAHDIDSHFNDKIQCRQDFDAIVPFQPLTREHLVDVLEQRVAQIRPNLSITNAAVEALLDPSRVEYLEWRKRPVEKDGPSVLFMTVALDGAQVLDERSSPLWQELLVQIHECLGRNDDNNDEKYGVIDFKWEKILLKSCVSAAENECQEVCRFAI